jgi:HEAT repeat protein
MKATKHVLPVLAVLFAGCARSHSPTMAGGKPVSHWVEELQNRDAKARKHAVNKLGNVGTNDSAALPAILSALTDRDPAVRAEAILATMKCGQSAKEAIPVLAQLQKTDRDSRVREYAGKALEKLQQ